jgi:hypothetical protein
LSTAIELATGGSTNKETTTKPIKKEKNKNRRKIIN